MKDTELLIKNWDTNIIKSTIASYNKRIASYKKSERDALYNRMVKTNKLLKAELSNR